MADNQNDKPATSQQIFKVIFYNENELYEVFAKQIFNSDLYGFVEIEEFLFGEKTQIVVDPSEEKLKAEFAGVRRSYVPQQNIVRIDEVEKVGEVKITESPAGSNVSRFPVGGAK